jgi:predicted phosphatase
MGKNLVERDVLVLPMDVTAVDQLEFHFQQVMEHFGKVKICFIILFFI